MKGPSNGNDPAQGHMVELPDAAQSQAASQKPAAMTG